MALLSQETMPIAPETSASVSLLRTIKRSDYLAVIGCMAQLANDLIRQRFKLRHSSDNFLTLD